MIHDPSANTDENNPADMDDDLSEGLGENLSDVRCDNLSKPETTTGSGITSILKMIEDKRAMLNNAIQEYSELCVQNVELMEANQEYHRESIRPEATKTKMVDMTHAEPYRSETKELENCLQPLSSNFQSHMHRFLRGAVDKVSSAACRLCIWNNDPEPTQRQKQMTDLVKWLGDLWRDSDLYFQDYVGRFR